MSDSKLEVSQLEAALRDAESLTGKLRGLLARARVAGNKPYSAPRNPDKSGFKNVYGRLTEAGIAELRRLVDAGVRDSEIARALDLTPAAVAGRRNEYQSERKRGPRKRA